MLLCYFKKVQPSLEYYFIFQIPSWPLLVCRIKESLKNVGIYLTAESLLQTFISILNVYITFGESFPSSVRFSQNVDSWPENLPLICWNNIRRAVILYHLYGCLCVPYCTEFNKQLFSMSIFIQLRGMLIYKAMLYFYILRKGESVYPYTRAGSK